MKQVRQVKIRRARARSRAVVDEITVRQHRTYSVCVHFWGLFDVISALRSVQTDRGASHAHYFFEKLCVEFVSSWCHLSDIMDWGLDLWVSLLWTSTLTMNLCVFKTSVQLKTSSYSRSHMVLCLMCVFESFTQNLSLVQEFCFHEEYFTVTLNFIDFMKQI